MGSVQPKVTGKGDGASIVKATEGDISTIKRIVDLAYGKYVERIGRPPAPMTADWPSLLATHEVYVLRSAAAGDITDAGDVTDAGPGARQGRVVGAIVLGMAPGADSSVKINNLVVDPGMQGRGYGKKLMQFAEDTARANGRPALTLFTNALMHENLALYPRLGFKETERRVEDGYDRVYFRKDLS